MHARRRVLGIGAVVLGSCGLVPRRGAAAAGVVEIRMKSDASGSRVYFDPIGILIAPGQAVRWVCEANVHTTTAYHPKNGDHSLRIPETAQPWDSGYLLPGKSFEVTLTAEGVYDYFCKPHEMAGMVGRIVVGKPGGPGALPFDYFKGRPGTSSWLAVPQAARAAFPKIADIMGKGVVHVSG
ncbi:MAG: plastocyanin/azurin family copper-binding protein [Acetobacteraceae bacterium]